MRFKNDAARAAFTERLGGAILDAMERNQDMLSEAVYEGRQGLVEMSDESLISLGLVCYGLEPAPGSLGGAPFALPLRFDGDALISASAELIERFCDATRDERAYLVKAINCHEALVALLDAPDLQIEELEPETYRLIEAARAALEANP